MLSRKESMAQRETRDGCAVVRVPCSLDSSRDGSFGPRSVASWSRMESRSDAAVARRSTVRLVSMASSSLDGVGGIVMRGRSGVERIAARGARSSAALIGEAS
eukprot:1032280-Pleurochrysis_carterae.AAC.2